MQPSEAYSAPDIISAWVLAASRVASSQPTPYVISVTAGVNWYGTSEEQQALDELATSFGFERPSSVAEVLLPRLVERSVTPPQQSLEAGLRLFARGRRKGLRYSGWSHTYFERLVGAWYDRFGARHVIKANRLLQAIEKLNEWDRNAEAVFYIHTDVSSDGFRPRGSPCLQYLQLRAHGNRKLSIVGLYRAHDYGNKFLGNVIALQRIGRFIASRTAREYDGLTIISLNPFCDQKTQLKKLIASVET